MTSIEPRESPFRRWLLCECVDAYLPTDEAQRRQFEDLLLSEPDPGVRTMTMTMLERIKQEGREEGREEGQRDLIGWQLEERFGPLSETAKARLQQISRDHLAELGRAVLKAQSLDDLGLGSR